MMWYDVMWLASKCNEEVWLVVRWCEVRQCGRRHVMSRDDL